MSRLNINYDYIVHQVTFQNSRVSTRLCEKLKGIYLMDDANLSFLYGVDSQKLVSDLVDIEPVAVTARNLADHREALAHAEVALAGWGVPVLDEAFFELAPRLKAIFYAAGSIRYFVTPAVWKRDMVISSAYAVNAVPVGEYTLATILLSLKHFWRLSREAKAGAPWGDHRRMVPGGYQSIVGLVSAGRIARHVLSLLKSHDIKRVINCPFLTRHQADDLGAELISLNALFSESDVVSIHTPLLESTRGMIGFDLISSMKQGATLINTARGEVIQEDELIQVLSARPDLTAVLDVTQDEPPSPGSPLLEMPNVVLTPHIAGSQGRECRRLGRTMAEELNRYLNNEPLLWQITKEMAHVLA